MGNINSSPGVYTSERDFSKRAAAVTTSVAVVIGEANQGAVGIPTLVTTETEYIAQFGKPDVSLGYMGHSAVAFLTEGNQLYVVRVAPNAKYGGCYISWDGKFNTSRTFDEGVPSPDDISLNPSDLFAVYAVNPGDWNANLFIRVYPDTRAGGGYFFLDVFQYGATDPLEHWRCHLDYRVDGFGTQLNVESQINAGSSFIRILQNHENAALVENVNRQLVNALDAGGDPAYAGIRISGGENGARPTKYDFINAVDLFEDKESLKVNMFINAGIYDTDYQRALVQLCEDRMDCVAILDVPSDKQKVQSALAFRRQTLMVDSSYAALYSPDLYVADQHNSVRLYVPPSGFVAACFARTDREFETWFAPAGMDRGNLPVAGVRETYNQGHRNALYESQINAVRVIEGSGIKLWGADTLQILDSSLSNISVRRLMIFIESSMEEVLLYSVFDPNDQALRSRLEDAGTRLLRPIRDASGLYDFGVVCDETNNTPETIANGDLYIDFWLDPTLPVKRVQFTAIINKTGVRVTSKT